MFLAANALGFRAVTPVFDGASDKLIEDELGRAWLALQADALKPNHGQNGHRADGHGLFSYENLDLPKFEAWLTERGYDAREVLDDTRIGSARRACIEQWLETVVGARKVRGIPPEKLEERFPDELVVIGRSGSG